ncbi:ATP-binding protein [Streptomyces sp. URMC 123]|uniref:ATP-binding protein n=1 Tax=Streptomyces sp. URMC 123 TaxID=3423403 RepID=UPI003F1B6741
MDRVGTPPTGARAGQDRGVRTPSRTLERESEIIAAKAALDRVGGGAGDGGGPAAPRGGLLAYTGPAGAGKTTLLAEVRLLAAERGCTTLVARGGEQERGAAFHVVRQLLQPLLASIGEAERAEVLGAWQRIIGPCLGLCPPAEGAAPDPQGVRDGLDWVVTNVAVTRGPLVLMLDDAHWADQESLAWLTSFVGRVEELPVLVIVAYRPDELPDAAAGFGAIVDRNRVRPLDLAPLSPVAVSELVRWSLCPGADATVNGAGGTGGTEGAEGTGSGSGEGAGGCPGASGAGPEAEEGFSHEVWLLTGGNPFEAVELIAKARERGMAPTDENAPLLRDMAASARGSGVLDRLDQLGTGDVRLAWAVAVLGAEASPALAASLAGMGPAEAADSMERLRAARILHSGGALEFSHPLIATAVYRAIPAAVRVALHGKAAWELIEGGHGPAAAARHLLETHPEGDEWVARQLQEAAREYLRTGAPDAARRCLERALREPPPPALRASVLYELGAPALLMDPAATVNHLRAALEEPDIDPAMREGVVIRLARSLAHCDQVPEAASVLAREARRATDSRVRLRMHTEHFMRAAFTAEEDGAPARSRRLAQLAQRLTGRDLTERYALGLRGWDAVVRGEPAETALEYAERALGPGLSWVDDNWGFEVPALIGLTFLYCDRPDRAEELFTEGISEFERHAWRGAHLAFGYTLLGYIRFRSGRLTDAEDFVRAGLGLAERVGPGTPGQWYAVGALIEILLARGQTDAAEELAVRYGFGKPFPSAVTIPNAQVVLGTLRLAQGRLKEAAEELSEVGHRLDVRGMHHPLWCPWMPQLALALENADPRRALELAEEAVRRAERVGTDSALGRTLHVLARISEGPERVSLLHRAVTHLEKSPATYELADALVDLGVLLRRTGRLQQAADHLYRGVEVATPCGAEAVVARARGELVAAGLRPRRLGVVR